MRRFVGFSLAASVAVTGLSLDARQTASAADLPVVHKAPVAAPEYNWTGLYIGANAGYVWGDANILVPAVDPGFTPPYQAYLPVTGSLHLHPDGFLGGVQVGYNYQTGNFLLGSEGDAQYMRLKASRDTGIIAGPFPVPGHNAQFQEAVSGDNLYTVRLRGGIVSGPALFYATGGLAVTQVNFSRFIGTLANTDNYVGSVSSTKTGWTFGGGLEYAMSSKWSVKAEYLYLDFGTVGFRSIGSGFGRGFIDSQMKLAAQIARVGLNYRLGGPVVAKY